MIETFRKVVLNDNKKNFDKWVIQRLTDELQERTGGEVKKIELRHDSERDFGLMVGGALIMPDDPTRGFLFAHHLDERGFFHGYIEHIAQKIAEQIKNQHRSDSGAPIKKMEESP